MRPRSPLGPAEPGEASDQQVDEADRRAATRARIAEDVVVVRQLQAAGFEGRDYDRFTGEMAVYGYKVMDRWTRTRRIFTECAVQHGIHLKVIAWTEDDRASLVQDTLATGHRRFCQHALRGGRWTPDGGACLKTYFVGNLVFAFADEYRPWREAEEARRLAQRELVPTMGAVLSDRTQRVGAVVVDRQTARAGLKELADIDERLPKILVLEAYGYTHIEIAELLGDGTSPKAVEGILYRHRQRLRKEKGHR